jgi:nucleoside-diphosphate-sugar epimerase
MTGVEVSMRVFLTGASGFVGSAVLSELRSAGHRVLALARSDAAAARLADAGVEVHRGDLVDLAGLRAGAAACDGVVHCAFPHDDFADRANNCAKDRAAIGALGEALAGSDRPLVVTFGTPRLAGRALTEIDAPDPASPDPRAASEAVALAFADRGVRVSTLRLPPTVHGDGDHGFVPMLIAAARRTGVSGYVGDGANRWPAVHRLDAARLYVLALEGAAAGSRVHAVAEEGVPTRAIADAIGRGTGLPVASVDAGHFGWLGAFFALDVTASSALTRARHGWTPTQPTLLEDLAGSSYFAT